MKILQMYHMNHLKLAQLLIDGDVESNPGPVTKNSGKGRPKKSKNFNFKPKKLNFSPVVDNRFINESELIHLNDIQPWSNIYKGSVKSTQYDFIPALNKKVSLIQADIINLKVDAIVNAAQKSLLGGGGIDGCIHKAAGIELKSKCDKLPQIAPGIRCETGHCKVTDTEGCNLNCQYVFHTVGPNVIDHNKIDEYKKQLKNCYENCFSNLFLCQYKNSNPIKSIAFPCISTGIYHFDNREAAEIALETVRLWLETHHPSIEQVIFCTYEDKDFHIYNELMPKYFPTSELPSGNDILDNNNMENESLEMTSSGNNALNSKLEMIPNDPRVENNELSYMEYQNITPIGLKNCYIDNDGSTKCANVCFFNALIQILVSIPGYRDYILHSNIDNSVVTSLKHLFNVMKNSNNSVNTFPYVQELGIPHYISYDQHDARHCLSHILENSYPADLKNESVFNIKSLVTNICQCGKEYPRNEGELFFKLDTENTDIFGSIQLLLDNSISQNGHRNTEYQCRGDLINEEIIPGVDAGCQRIGTCTEYTTLEVLGDFLIILVQLFRYENNRSYKVTPNITINEQITCFDSFELCGIVWHSGPTIDSGHYFSNVKINGQWFLTNDTMVEPGLKQYNPNSLMKEAPYILVYKRNMPLPLLSTPTTTVHALTNESLDDDETEIDSDIENDEIKKAS